MCCPLPRPPNAHATRSGPAVAPALLLRFSPRPALAVRSPAGPVGAVSPARCSWSPEPLPGGFGAPAFLGVAPRCRCVLRGLGPARGPAAKPARAPAVPAGAAARRGRSGPGCRSRERVRLAVVVGNLVRVLTGWSSRFCPSPPPSRPSHASFSRWRWFVVAGLPRSVHGVDRHTGSSRCPEGGVCVELLGVGATCVGGRCLSACACRVRGPEWRDPRLGKGSRGLSRPPLSVRSRVTCARSSLSPRAPVPPLPRSPRLVSRTGFARFALLPG